MGGADSDGYLQHIYQVCIRFRAMPYCIEKERHWNVSGSRNVINGSIFHCPSATFDAAVRRGTRICLRRSCWKLSKPAVPFHSLLYEGIHHGKQLRFWQEVFRSRPHALVKYVSSCALRQQNVQRFFLTIQQRNRFFAPIREWLGELRSARE